jgi:carboxylesterase type B
LTEKTLALVVKLSGCGDYDAFSTAHDVHGRTTSEDAIACLTRLSVEKLLTVVNASNASFSPTPDGVELLDLPWVLAEQGDVAPGVAVILGSTAEDSDANLTASLTNLTTTRADFEAFLVNQLPWANRSDLQQLTALYGNDSGVPHNARTRKLLESQTSFPGDNRLNASYSRWYWAAKHLLADAEMFCPNRRAARWISRANHADRPSNTAASPRVAYAWQFLFAYVPIVHSLGSGAAHNADTAFWFHVRHSPNASARLNSEAEVALSLKMARWWLSHAATQNPNRGSFPTAAAGARNDPHWPGFPLDGTRGAAHEPLMVLSINGQRGTKIDTTVVWGGREKHCAFWDTVPAELTPEG